MQFNITYQWAQESAISTKWILNANYLRRASILYTWTARKQILSIL